jgi:hypothetical protein
MDFAGQGAGHFRGQIKAIDSGCRAAEKYAKARRVRQRRKPVDAFRGRP